MTPEEALERAGMILRIPGPAKGTWARTVRSGSLLFVAGHGPFVGGEIAHPGKVGAELTVETGRSEAELTMINILGTLRRSWASSRGSRGSCGSWCS